MWPMSSQRPHHLFACLILKTVGLTTVAMADPIEPSKIHTIPVRPEAAEDNRPSTPPPPNSSPKVRILTVRPHLPGEPRDPANQPASPAQNPGDPASTADPHVVRTIPVKPDSHAEPDAGRRMIRTFPVPAQSAPQDALGSDAAR
jgi:hypothetical protein